MVEVRPRRVFSNGHTYHVNSISVNSDGETYLSADDLRINMWHLGITDRSFSILPACFPLIHFPSLWDLGSFAVIYWFFFFFFFFTNSNWQGFDLIALSIKMPFEEQSHVTKKHLIQHSWWNTCMYGHARGFIANASSTWHTFQSATFAVYYDFYIFIIYSLCNKKHNPLIVIWIQHLYLK